MTMRVTILSTVMGESGSLLAAGSTYTVGDQFGQELVRSGRATDTDRALAVPQTELKPYFATDPLTGAVTGLVGPDGNANSVFGITNKARKWQAAIGKMRNGVRNAKLLMLGDSTGVGAGATGAAGFGAGGRLKTTPLYLASELNRTYYPANCHAVWGEGNMASIATLAAFDTRLVFGSAWTYQLLDTGGIGGRALKVTAAANSNLDFTPTATGAASASVDTFVVWYVKASSSAKFSWSIDAGGATVVDTSNATNDIGSVTIPAGSLGTHTLHLLWNAVGATGGGSNLWILGIQAYDSTQKQIEVWQGGYNGAFVSTMNGAAQPWCVTPMIASLAPDLTVIQLQINDAAIAATPVATYKANLQTLVTTCLAVGDVMLRTGYPSQVSYNANTPLANQKLYRDAIAAVALENDVTFDDVWTRMGSYEIQQAVLGGAMYADGLHPTGSVYASSASNLAKILRSY